MYLCSFSVCIYLFFDILFFVLRNFGFFYDGYIYIINFISKESKIRIIIFILKINYYLVYVVYLL